MSDRPAETPDGPMDGDTGHNTFILNSSLSPITTTTTTTTTTAPSRPNPDPIQSNLQCSSEDTWVSMDVAKFGKSFYNAEKPLNDNIKRLKQKSLSQCLNSNHKQELVEYLRSADGLISNDIRCKAWPILLDMPLEGEGVVCSDVDMFLDDLNVADKPLHKDEDQVKLDIKRLFTILNHVQFTKADVDELKKKLSSLVIRLLRKYPSLHYYQGFHDIASIILIVCYNPHTKDTDDQLAFKMLEKLSLNHLRDYMISDISLSLAHLKLIPALLEIVDHEFFKLVKQLNNNYIMTNMNYYDYSFYQGLSCILTMFSHDLDDLHQVLVVWDFILSYNSLLVSIYIYVAAIMFKKDEIYKQLGIKDTTINFLSIDKDLLHNVLSSSSLFSKLSDGDIVQILNDAKGYYENYPITKLSNSSYTYDVWFDEFNVHSVLKTTSKPYSPSTYKITSADQLQDLIILQDEEMAKLGVHNLMEEKKFLDDELTDYETPTPTSMDNSLLSLLLSLQSSTSSLNTKILRTSSIYFKKLLFPDNEEKSVARRNNIFKLTTIYKVSLTVGFLGFLLHFLFTRQSHVLYKYLDNINFKPNWFNGIGINIKGSLNNVGFNYLRSSLYGYLG